MASTMASLLAEPVSQCLTSLQMFLSTSESEKLACQMQTLAQQSEIGPESLHFFFFKFSNVLVSSQSMWDLSSLTRDLTGAPSIGSLES